MTRRDRLEILKLIYTETNTNDLLTKISQLDKSRELNIWKYIFDRTDLYRLILKTKTREELSELTAEIGEFTFDYNEYFYKDINDNNKLYGAKRFKEQIIDTLEYELWNYFEESEESEEPNE